jgi:hypothetical protein
LKFATHKTAPENNGNSWLDHKSEGRTAALFAGCRIKILTFNCKIV